MIENITPEAAKRLIESNAAVLIDIREAAEHARENIWGAISAPLSRISSTNVARGQAPTAIFHCQGGNRTQANAAKLARCGFEKIYLLEGGILAWKAAGLPTGIDRRQPIELQRQVQITAGVLILIALALSVLISPWFAILVGVVGSGLMFAGISGRCGMARLLRVMPWNKVAST